MWLPGPVSRERRSRSCSIERADVKIPDETRQRVVDAAQRARLLAERLGPAAGRWAQPRHRPRPPPVARTGRQRRGPGRDAARPVVGGARGWLPGDGRAARAGRRRHLVQRAPPRPARRRADRLGSARPTTRRSSSSSATASRSSSRGRSPTSRCQSVDVDNVAGARGAVEHLLGLGHRRIACITNARLVYTAAQERLAGYTEALTRGRHRHRERADRRGRLRCPQRPRRDGRADRRGPPSTPPSSPATWSPSAPSERCARPA